MKKIVYIALCMLLVGLIGTALSWNVSGVFTMDTVAMQDQRVVDSQSINEINVHTSSTDVQMSSTDDTDITIELKGNISEKLKDTFILEVVEKEGKVDVTVSRKNSFSIGVNIERVALEIKVPSKLYERISIETSSGVIDLQNLHADDIRLKASSGSVTAKNLIADSKFYTQTSSGKIQTINNRVPSFEAKSNSGSILVERHTSEESKLSTSSGRISVENMSGNIRASSSSGAIIVTNDEVMGDIEANTSSGSVKVNYRENPESLVIDFKGSSGNGKVSLDGVHYQTKSDNEIVGQIGSGEYQLRVRTSSGSFKLN